MPLPAQASKAARQAAQGGVMRNLSLDQLKALETVAALRSFTAAARRLELSQPAVSTQVSELEQRLGLRLIERVGKKAFATAAGLEVIAHARRIAAEVEAAGIAMRRHREGFFGRVRVGALPAILNYILLPGIVSFQRAYPNIEVVLRTWNDARIGPAAGRERARSRARHAPGRRQGDRRRAAAPAPAARRLSGIDAGSSRRDLAGRDDAPSADRRRREPDRRAGACLVARGGS